MTKGQLFSHVQILVWCARVLARASSKAFSYVGRGLALPVNCIAALGMRTGRTPFSAHRVSITGEIVTVHLLCKYTNTKPSPISLGLRPH